MKILSAHEFFSQSFSELTLFRCSTLTPLRWSHAFVKHFSHSDNCPVGNDTSWAKTPIKHLAIKICLCCGNNSCSTNVTATEILIKEACHSHLQLYKWLTRWVCKAGGPSDYHCPLAWWFVLSRVAICLCVHECVFSSCACVCVIDKKEKSNQ